MVGITTQDYVSYAFDEGEVKNLTIKNVTGSNNIRIVLLGNTKYAITNVIIDNIRQLGTGHLVTIGDGASTDGSVRVDEITITNAYSDNISSWILLQHKNMGKVKVENTTNLIYLSRNATGGSASIEKLIVKNGNSVSADATYTTKMDQVVLENIFGGGIKLSGEKTNVCIRNYVCTIARAAVELNGHTAKIILDNCNLKTTGTGEDHIVSYTGIIDDIEIINSKLYAGGLVTQAAIVGTTSSTSICRKVTINNCETGEHQSIFRGYYSATDITPELVLSNVSITTTNRLVELTAGYNLVLRYNNIKISSPLNELFRGTSGQKLTAYGHGWDCTKTMLVGTITCESYAQDFPVKADLLNKVAKGACYNVNSALTCGIGYLISDGTSWKNLFSGATY
jgi:hypothetical protein